MTLVVLAHGTNDPAGRATWGALLTGVRARLPEVSVRLAWAGVARPQLADLLPKLPDEPVVVVPASAGVSVLVLEQADNTLPAQKATARARRVQEEVRFMWCWDW